VLIILVHTCCIINASFSSDGDGTECLEAYLQQKGKLSIDFPLKPSSFFYCRFVTSITLRVVESLIEDNIKEAIPNDADCLIREFKNQESLDYVVKLSVIEDSNLSETDINTQTNATRNQLKHDLKKTALQCETDEQKFITIFNDFLGIKNETLAALHHNYCFAKYAADKELLPLEDIELNPNGIITTHIDCNSIIKKERRKHERNAREKSKERRPKSSNCIMEAYRRKNVFDAYIKLQVIEYVEFPKKNQRRGNEKSN